MNHNWYTELDPDFYCMPLGYKIWINKDGSSFKQRKNEYLLCIEGGSEISKSLTDSVMDVFPYDTQKLKIIIRNFRYKTFPDPDWTISNTDLDP